MWIFLQLISFVANYQRHKVTTYGRLYMRRLRHFYVNSKIRLDQIYIYEKAIEKYWPTHRTVGLLRVCSTFYGDYYETVKSGGWRTQPLVTPAASFIDIVD